MAKWSDGLQRYLNRDDLNLKTSGAEIASTTGVAQEIGDKAVMNLVVDITVISGTGPTMLVTVEGSNDNLNWYTLGRVGANGYVVGDSGTDPTNFTTGTYTKRVALPAARYVRYRSTIGGTGPSFTYSVGGDTA